MAQDVGRTVLEEFEGVGGINKLILLAMNQQARTLELGHERNVVEVLREDRREEAEVLVGYAFY